MFGLSVPSNLLGKPIECEFESARFGAQIILIKNIIIYKECEDPSRHNNVEDAQQLTSEIQSQLKSGLTMPQSSPAVSRRHVGE